ncbi:hypothetical protein ACIP98_41490 [Streptomyces sp. NPDC088354]|uniref:hypothetical protein n=1 Tax=Streptomyces sp. NPDC088354 TaxID=3365856 RepID=UPI00382A3033
MPVPASLLVSVAVSVSRRPARSRVRHGQASCADYGCTEPACRQAARRARRDRQLDHAAGRTAKVDLSQAAEHATLLRRRGMSAQDIANISGISVTLIRRLLRPRSTGPGRISRTTADAILGITIPTPTTPSSGGGGRGLTDTVRAAAILTTLAASGWPANYLAARLGISTQTIAAIRDGKRPRIRIALDQNIRILYPRLASTTPTDVGIPPSDIARTLAYHRRRLTAATTPNMAG